MTEQVAFIAPTFWGPPQEQFFTDTDQIYDHPIAIDQPGCLSRFLRSLDCLKGDFSVVLSSASSSRKWEDEVDERIRQDIKQHSGGYNCHLFGYREFRKLKDYIEQTNREELLVPLSMYGYSDVRNMSILAAHILGHDLIISTDDDVVVDDPHYIEKAGEQINRPAPGREEPVKVVCGPYYTEEGTINYATRPPDWMAYWNNAEAMNEAFNRYIFGEPRLKESSYVVMGNIVLHRDYFTEVPLDPGCHRGEDMDWLINGRVSGFRFFMDREFSVQHKPPPRGFPLWQLVRLDIERFIYDRKKVRQIEEQLQIPADYFDPWPGRFLTDDLEERIYKTNMMLSQQYLIDGDKEAAQGCLENIFYGRHEYKPGDPLGEFRSFQSCWQELMGFIDRQRDELKELLF